MLIQPRSTSPKNWDQIVSDVNARMAEYVQQYITPLSYEDEDGPALSGSGMFVRLAGEAYTLSCEHVIQTHVRGKRLSYLVGDDYFQLGMAITRPEPLDLGLAPIANPAFHSGEKRALPVSKIAAQFSVDPAELLFLGGFPGEKSRYMPWDNSLHTKLVPYTARKKTLPDSSRYIAEYHFAMEYNFDAKRADGSHATLPRAGGFSGSPIWDTGFHASGYSSYWNPSLARVIGIACFWDQSSSAIVATKATMIREFLLEAIREQAILENWFSRGEKEDDRHIDIEYALRKHPHLL